MGIGAVALATVFMEPGQFNSAHTVQLGKVVQAQEISNFTITIIPGPECYDGEDNDEDGLIDFPDDDDCESENDTTEGIPPPPPPSSSAGPQPSGGTGMVIEPSTSVTFTGYAYPGSKVILLRDAEVVALTTAGLDARFSIALSGLSPGNQLFLLYAESTAGRRSELHPFPLALQKGSFTSIAGVVLSPTIKIDKLTVKQGSNLGIFGDTAPDARLTVALFPGGIPLQTFHAGSDGIYNQVLRTDRLTRGEYTLKISSLIDGYRSGYSVSRAFTVSDKDTLLPPEGPCTPGDINCDGRVDLVDFSIAAFWYKQPLEGDIIERERTSLSGDGVIDLRDFSIMAYYWTG